MLRRSLTRETHTVVRETDSPSQFDYDDDDDDDDDDNDTSPTSFDLYGSVYAVHGDGILSCIDSKWEWRREEEAEEGEGSDSIVNESDSDASSDDGDVPPPPPTTVRTTVNGEESREHFARDRDRCIVTSTGMDARDCEDARRDLKPKQLCFALKPKERKFQRRSCHADRLFSYDDDE